mgnify:CR=1 FL=1
MISLINPHKIHGRWCYGYALDAYYKSSEKFRAPDNTISYYKPLTPLAKALDDYYASKSFYNKNQICEVSESFFRKTSFIKSFDIIYAFTERYNPKPFYELINSMLSEYKIPFYTSLKSDYRKNLSYFPTAAEELLLNRMKENAAEPLILIITDIFENKRLFNRAAEMLSSGCPKNIVLFSLTDKSICL